VPAPEFLSEKEYIFFASKISIEGQAAARFGDRIEADQINTTVIEPNPNAAHEAAERISGSAFDACAKRCRSAHVALLIPWLSGSTLISRSATRPVL
jgi:hypothetical protein